MLVQSHQLALAAQVQHFRTIELEPCLGCSSVDFFERILLEEKRY